MKIYQKQCETLEQLLRHFEFALLEHLKDCPNKLLANQSARYIGYKHKPHNKSDKVQFFSHKNNFSVCNHTRDKQIGLPLRGRPILLSLV